MCAIREVVKFFELRNMNLEHGSNLGLKERGGKVVMGKKACLNGVIAKEKSFSLLEWLSCIPE